MGGPPHYELESPSAAAGQSEAAVAALRQRRKKLKALDLAHGLACARGSADERRRMLPVLTRAYAWHIKTSTR